MNEILGVFNVNTYNTGRKIYKMKAKYESFILGLNIILNEIYQISEVSDISKIQFGWSRP